MKVLSDGPWLSIITVNMNNADGLRKTIQSVIRQTCTDFEFIIIDGASSDNSVPLIRESENDVDYWVSEPDTGIYHAMNKGIMRAKGHYCLFLNSGDFLLKETVLQELFSLDFDEDIVSGGVVTYSANSSEKRVRMNIRSSQVTLNDLYNSSLNHQATFIKRDLFERYGLYDESYLVSADTEFFVRALIICNSSFRVLDKLVSCFNTDGISSKLYEQGDHSEHMAALAKLIPPRILSDYSTGYINKVKYLNKFGVSRFLLKALILITNSCDRLFKESFSSLHSAKGARDSKVK